MCFQQPVVPWQEQGIPMYIMTWNTAPKRVTEEIDHTTGSSPELVGFFLLVCSLTGRKSFHRDVFLYWKIWGNFSIKCTSIPSPFAGWAKCGLSISLAPLNAEFQVRGRNKQLQGRDDLESMSLPSFEVCTRVDGSEEACLFPLQMLRIHTVRLILQSKVFSPGRKAGISTNLYLFALKYR